MSPFATLRWLLLPGCALALAAGSGRASLAVDVAPQLARDTTLVFATGDAVQVRVREMTAMGTEVCAALGPGVDGRKSLYAGNNARTPGAALPTTVRFPAAGTTPRCERHRQTAGDSIHFQLIRLVVEGGQLQRTAVGYHALPLAGLNRRRITFRWLRDGGDEAPQEEQPAVDGRTGGS